MSKADELESLRARVCNWSLNDDSARISVPLRELRAVLDRLSAQQREPVVRVKELEWTSVFGRPATRAESLSSIGLYIIADLDGTGRFSVGLDNGACAAFLLDEAGNKQLRYSSIHEAAAAAQADYEQRIMAALEIVARSSTVEPTAHNSLDAGSSPAAPTSSDGSVEGHAGDAKQATGAAVTGAPPTSGDTISPTDLLAAGVESGPSEAIADIAAERRRQIEVEGWTPEHDAAHDMGELARAAICYADPLNEVREQPPAKWPWSSDWWKPKDRRRDLVRAGALIVAEIERLDRLANIGRR